jgi:multidrug efflux system membrane fusion protein
VILNVVASLSSAFFLFLILTSCSSAPNANSGAMVLPPVPVSTAEAKEELVPIQVRAVGNVEPLSSVGVKAQIGGPLLAVKFAEGATVAAGDLLF